MSEENKTDFDCPACGRCYSDWTLDKAITFATTGHCCDICREESEVSA